VENPQEYDLDGAHTERIDRGHEGKGRAAIERPAHDEERPEK
jgi:hypothetical protein